MITSIYFPLQHKSGMTPLKLLALVIGFAGVIIVSVADIQMALASDGECRFVKVNGTHNNLNITHTNGSVPAKILSWNMCTKYTHLQVSMSLLALLGGSLMWSVSSGL